MKKQIATTLAVLALAGATTVFAANPFTDVEQGHWAYQSVSQLAAAGVINGYPDGTFKGERHITRYEMAQMIAKAMANQDRANAEQQAMINRLADEFADELNNLGVRVDNLEKRVGNVKVTGDFRTRYSGFEGRNASGQQAMTGGELRRTAAVAPNFGPDGPQTLVFDEGNGPELHPIALEYMYNEYGRKDKWDFRARLQFDATVNPSTDVTVRVTTGNIEYGEDNGNVSVDRAFATHRFGDKAKVELGRVGLKMGQGFFYDDGFDGIKAKVGNDKLALTAAYGQPYMAEKDVTFLSPVKKDFVNMSDIDFTFLQLDAALTDNVDVNAFYLDGHGQFPFGAAYGVGLNGQFDKVWIGGEWLKLRDGDIKFEEEFPARSAWFAGIGYGDYNMAERGTWDVKLQYVDIGVLPLVSSKYYIAKEIDHKGWLATVDYAVAKNVGLSLYYGFGGKSKSGLEESEELSKVDYYRAELNYRF